MNQLADFLVWMQIEEPHMPLDYNEREGYFYHDIVEKMFKAWKVSHMCWTPLASRISPEKKRSFKEDDFPETLVDRLNGLNHMAMGAQKPSKIEMEAAREIERLRAERDALIMEMKWRTNDTKTS
jgi:hypothetical protein